MKRTLTEHSKKVRIETAKEWQKKKHDEGAYSFKVMITNKELAETAKNIPNKAEFLRNAIEEIILKKVS
jgi:hypothetical protein